ncbi:MAG: amidohydrolase family protein [Acidobacteria bacterium]|nr:amidohydrolase family protein [Acidobacteriota bacterium]
MTRRRLGALLLCLAMPMAVVDVAAQDLVVTNARIIVGNGNVIEGGAIVVRGGRIVSVGQAATPPGVRVVDARGMTAMPGFIDAHRHIINGNTEQWFAKEATVRMQEFLEAGYTTLMSGGGPVPGIVQLKTRIEKGELKGPRIITSGRADPDLFKTEAEARAGVQKLAQAGVEIIKARIDPPAAAPQVAMLAVVTDEARKHNLDVMVHAVSPAAMLAAVKAGARKLVHTPHNGWLTEADARIVKDAGIEVLSTIGFGVPVFGVFNNDNVPTFRDGKPWPSGIIDGPDGRGREAGEKAVNGRTLWDAGVTYGFGTDTGYLPKAGLAHELRALNLMFSPQDIVKLMGPNTAAFIEKSADLGTLEAGKLADIVLLDGNPLDGYWNLLNARVVIKGGDVVVDKR